MDHPNALKITYQGQEIDSYMRDDKAFRSIMAHYSLYKNNLEILKSLKRQNYYMTHPLAKEKSVSQWEHLAVQLAVVQGGSLEEEQLENAYLKGLPLK